MTRHALFLLSAATILTACANTDVPVTDPNVNIAGSAANNCVQMAVADTGLDAGEVQISSAGGADYDVTVVGARFFCSTAADGTVTSFKPV